MTSIRPALVIACAAALAGCRTSEAAPAVKPAGAVHVESAAVREEPMPRALTLTGTLRGKEQVELAANAAGRVIETLVERGAHVQKGDVIARLDTRGAALTVAEARANAALARAQAETARRECERSQRLRDQGVISSAEYDRQADACRNAPLSIDAAEARARASALVISDGSIRAPFSGVITERFVEVGQYLRPDARVVALASIDPLRLELTVPEASAFAVKEGGALTFTVPAHRGRAFTGTVRFVGAAVRESSRDLVAEAVVENADHALYPGMFATISLATGEAPAPVVPRAALFEKEGLTHVFAIEGQRLAERVVARGAEKGDLVAVTRGLAPGERVVLHPAPALQNGQTID